MNDPEPNSDHGIEFADSDILFDGDFITIDTIAASYLDNQFPWDKLGETDLKDKLELLYIQYVKNPREFARNIAYSTIKSQNKQSTLAYLFEKEYIIPVVAEYLVAYEVEQHDIDKFKKKTLSKRELIFKTQENQFDLAGKTYIPIYSAENARKIIAPSSRSVISHLDVADYPKHAEHRIVNFEEELALTGFIIDPSFFPKGIQKFPFYNFKQPEFFSSTQIVYLHFVAQLIDNDISAKKQFDTIREMEKVDEFDSYFKSKVTLYPPDYLSEDELKLRKKFIEFSKLLTKYYPTLIVNDYFTVENFYHEIMNGIDKGWLGFIFSIICLGDESGDYKKILNSTELKINKNNFYLGEPKETSVNDGNVGGGSDKFTGGEHIKYDGNQHLYDAMNNYYRILSIKMISEKDLKTIKNRELKNQIYRSIILIIYGPTRYNELTTLSKKMRNLNFVDLVTKQEAAEIEEKHRSIVQYRHQYHSNTCGHFAVRRSYDLLDLDNIQKHNLFLLLKSDYSLDISRLTQTQKNNKQIVCKNDGFVIGCEHEYILAQMKKMPFSEKQKYQDILTKNFSEYNEDQDAVTCTYCGRKIEESKSLVLPFEHESSKQPIVRFRLSMTDTTDIESAIIRAVQRNEPGKGLDEATLRIEAQFLWDDVRRIMEYVEPTIVMYYNMIENKRDRLENFYKEISRICAIYAHIAYEILNFRPESRSFLSTPDSPWDEKDLNVQKVLRRCLFMMRLRFYNAMVRSAKIRKGMFSEYLVDIYKNYEKYRTESKTKIQLGFDRWVGIYYRIPWNKILLENFELYTPAISNKHHDKNFTKIKILAEKAIEEFKTGELSDRPSLDRLSINRIAGNKINEYMLIPYIYLVNLSNYQPTILPKDYTKHGVAQKWETIIITTKDGKVHEYKDKSYKEIYKKYQEYFASSYNASIILPHGYIPLNDLNIKTVDYKNSDGELKSDVSKSTYSKSEQESIKKLIDRNLSISSFYTYIYETQDKEFEQYIDERIKPDNKKGYISKNGSDISAKVFEEIVNTLKENLKSDSSSNKIIKNKISETVAPKPLKRELSSGIPSFKTIANDLVYRLFNATDDKVNTTSMNEFYEKLQILGRRTIQEQEEIDQYVKISDHMKGLKSEEISDIHTGYQVDKLKSYIRILYQSANMLYNVSEESGVNYIYETRQGKNLVRYLNKLVPPIDKIKIIAKKISIDTVKNTRMSKTQQVIHLFDIFYQICMLYISTSQLGAQFIKESLESFFIQDSTVNRSYRARDYQEDLGDVRRQAGYDQEQLRIKQMADSFAPGFIVGDDELITAVEPDQMNEFESGNKKDLRDEGRRAIKDEYRSGYEEYRPNIKWYNDQMN